MEKLGEITAGTVATPPVACTSADRSRSSSIACSRASLSSIAVSGLSSTSSSLSIRSRGETTVTGGEAWIRKSTGGKCTPIALRGPPTCSPSRNTIESISPSIISSALLRMAAWSASTITSWARRESRLPVSEPARASLMTSSMPRRRSASSKNSRTSTSSACLSSALPGRVSPSRYSHFSGKVASSH